MTSITISFFGLSCFKFEVKNEKEAVFVTDPFSKESGLKLPRNLAADFVTVSSDHPFHNETEAVKTLSEKGKWRIFSHPGEYEVKNVFVDGAAQDAKDKGGSEALRGVLPPPKDGKNMAKNTIFRFTIDDVTITHLGNLAANLTSDEIQTLSSCDVLLVPISSDAEFSASGGKNGITMKNLTDIIASVQPRIVIPMHYKTPRLKANLQSLDKFLKEIGKGKLETMKKFKFAKKDLPAEETKVVVLTTE